MNQPSNPLENDNIRYYQLASIPDLPPELEDADYVIVDASISIEDGCFVLGIKEGRPAAWKYAGEDLGIIVGRITQTGYIPRCY